MVVAHSSWPVAGTGLDRLGARAHATGSTYADRFAVEYVKIQKEILDEFAKGAWSLAS